MGTIYRASVAPWLFGVFASILELARLAYLDFGFWFPRNLSDADPSIWSNIAALWLAVLSTYGANRMVKSQRKCRERKIRGLARDAVEMATPFDLPGILDNEEFIKVCAQLSEDDEEEKEEREKKEGEIRAGL